MKASSVSFRFKTAVLKIIADNKLNGGKIINPTLFAKAIGHSDANLRKVLNYNQVVSTPIIESACKKYKINPTWLILGEGEMFLSEDLAGKVSELEKRLKKVENQVKPKSK